jgi:hypothetical protein
MSLPDRRPATLGQPVPPDPYTVVEPRAVMPVDRPPIAFVPDPYNPGRSVAVDARLLQPLPAYQPRDLTPVPLLDPLAQRLLAAGIGGGAAAAGVGWGLGEALNGLAGVSSGALFWLALLLAAARLPGARGRVQIHQETHVINHNRWLGRSHTSTHQR